MFLLSWLILTPYACCVLIQVPTTNPTSTAIFKSLLAIKTRNALVLCPHPRYAHAIRSCKTPKT